MACPRSSRPSGRTRRRRCSTMSVLLGSDVPGHVVPGRRGRRPSGCQWRIGAQPDRPFGVRHYARSTTCSSSRRWASSSSPRRPASPTSRASRRSLPGMATSRASSRFRGERLAFNAGIVVLAALSIVLVVAFGGRVELLIPLYAVGVFTAFTLSQSGMVRHWFSERGPGWRRSATLNGVGAVATGIVACCLRRGQVRTGRVDRADHRARSRRGNDLGRPAIPPRGAQPCRPAQGRHTAAQPRSST